MTITLKQVLKQHDQRVAEFWRSCSDEHLTRYLQDLFPAGRPPFERELPEFTKRELVLLRQALWPTPEFQEQQHLAAVELLARQKWW